MARNGSGTYSVPNTFVSGARVLVADVNTNFSDIGTALTGSLALDGQSAMTGQIKGAAGTISAPGWSWANETGSGWYRAGAADFRYSVSGSDVLKVTGSGFTVTGTLTVSGTFTATLAANTVVTATITDASVTTAKIADANVTPAKLSTGAPSWDTSGNLTASGAAIDSKGNLRDLPVNAQTTGYTLVAGDAGKVIAITTGGVSVPNSVFSAGKAVSIINDSGSAQTITQGSGVTMYQTGTTNTGNRTLAARGICTVVFTGASTAYISGNVS